MLTLHKAFAKFSGHGVLSLTWYVLEDTARAIGTLVVDTVPLKPWRRGGDPTHFYPPTKSKRVTRYPAKRPRAASGSGGGGAKASLDEVEGNEAEEEEQEDEVGLSDVEDAPGDLEYYLEEVMGDMLQPLDAVVQAAEQLVAAEQAAAPEAASAQDEPPTPPMAPPGQEARPRGRGAATVVFPWGKITYYASKRSFEAICRNPAHGKCVLTRSAKGRKTEPRGGRPLGFMAAWLQQGHVASKEVHWSPEVLNSSLPARIAGRNFVRAANQGLDLLSFERPRAADAGEASETEDSSAYM